MVPYSLLGPLGDFLHHIYYSYQLHFQIALGILVLAHIVEAIYAYTLARSAPSLHIGVLRA